MGDVALLTPEPSTIYDELMRGCLEDRVLIINEEIDDNVIDDCVLYILKWNKEDKHIPVEERTPIKLLINSPGGDLVTAMHMCDVISVSKTPVRAIGTGLVASAAFHIFIACQERIAFQNTVLLMHDGQLVVQNSSAKAKDTMKFYENIDSHVKKHVLKHTDMAEDYYDDHYDQELYLYADSAKELGVVDWIVGVDGDIDSLF